MLILVVLRDRVDGLITAPIQPALWLYGSLAMPMSISLAYGGLSAHSPR